MRSLLIISAAAYLIACAAPALVLHLARYQDANHFIWSGYKSVRGFDLLFNGLLFGWTRLNLTAFANIPLWFSWVLFLMKRYSAARACASAALILSLETLQLLVQPYIFDEGATVKGFLARPDFGFYCWILSMATMWIAGNRMLKMQSAAAY